MKNENSILVDNAGVTKNVAKMWDEYAQSIGTTAASLTMQQKIEAEYQGIMQETRFQVGDLAKAAETLTGKQAAAAQSTLLLTQAYGQSMTPAVGLVTDVIKGLTDVLTGLVNDMPALVSGVTAGSLAIGAMTIAAKAAQALKALNISLQAAAGGATLFGMSLKTAMPIMFALSAAIGLVTAAVSANAKAKEAAAAEAAEQAAKERERVQAIEAEADALKKLYSRYEELAGKQYRSLQESQELAQLQNTLETQYGISAGALDGLAGSYDRTTESAKALYRAQLNQLQVERDTAAATARAAWDAGNADAESAKQRIKAIEEVNGYLGAQAGYAAEMRREMTENGPTDYYRDLEKQYNKMTAEIENRAFEFNLSADLQKEMQNAQAAIAAKDGLFASWIAAEMNRAANAAEAGGAEVSERIRGVLDNAFMNHAKTQQNAPGFDVDALMVSYGNALNSADIGPALQAMDDLNARILGGGQIADSELPALQRHWQTLIDFADTATAGMSGDVAAFEGILISLAPAIAPVIYQTGALGEAITALQAATRNAKIGELIGNDAAQAKTAYESIRKDTESTTAQMVAAGESYARERGIVEALKNIRNSFTDTGAVTKEVLDGSIALMDQYGLAVPKDVEQADAALSNHRDRLTGMAVEANEGFRAMTEQVTLYRNVLTAMQRDPQADPAAIARVKALIADLEIARTTLKDLLGQVMNFDGDVKTSGADQLLDAIKKIETSAQGTQKSLENIRIKREQIADAQKMVTETQRLQKAGKAVSEEWRGSVSKALGADFRGSLEEASTSLDSFDMSLQGMVDQLASDLNSAERQIMDIINGVVSGTIDISVDGKTDMSGFMAAAQTALNIINTVRRIFGQSALTVPTAAKRSGGGGGGGSKPDPAEEARRAAEEAAREAEEARREAVRADLRQLEHKKTMNQLTVQQEIAALVQIKRAHQLTADELMDIDERLYEARERLKNDAYQWALTLLDHQVALGRVNVDQEIARLEEIKRAHELSTEELYQIEERLYNLRQNLLQEQESQVKTTYDRIVRALKARYDEQKRMELDALDDRIDALNAITKAENEADRRDDFAQNLADKQRELSVTKSARRRRELEAEIAEMQADEERRLAQEKRQAEIDEINKQKQAVSDKYSKLAEEENLRQEALRLVMSNNLDQMAHLIASYGDKWQDAGAQLAQALTDGVLANSNGIINSLNTLANSIQGNIDFQLRSVGSNLPAGSAGGVTVNVYGGLTVREEADVDLVARAIQQKIRAAGR